MFAGCGPTLDTTRSTEGQGTFGEESFALACQRVAYSAELSSAESRIDVSGGKTRAICHGEDAPADETPAAVRALVGRRSDLVSAVDAAVPDDFLDRLQGMLLTMLSLYDDGTMGVALSKLADLVRLMEEDGEFCAALSRLDGRFGYRPLAPAMGVARAVLSYPLIDDLLLRLLDLVDGGAADQAFQALLAALSAEMQGAEAVARPDDPERTLNLGLGFLLRTDPALGSGSPRLLVKRDSRAMAMVPRDLTTGALPAPFVDLNGDGLADAVDGRFVDAEGQVFQPPSPFLTVNHSQLGPSAERDTFGRPLTPSGKLLYEYIDLDQTVVAGLARDLVELVDPQKDIAFSLLHGASALLGPREERTKVVGGLPIAYQGFDTKRAAVLDLLYAFTQVLGDPGAIDTLSIVQALLRDHQRETARSVGALLKVKDMAKLHPEAEVDEKVTVWDDMAVLLRDLVNTPGLAEDLFAALAQPELESFMTINGMYMKYKDPFDLNSQSQQWVGEFKTEVDRSQPDSGMNRSLNQRLLHLVHHSNRARLCSKAGATLKIAGLELRSWDKECELLEINNTGLFYMQTVARQRDSDGNLTDTPKAHLYFKDPAVRAVAKDAVLQAMTGIRGLTTHPTTESMDRVLFLEPLPEMLEDLTGRARCTEGDTFLKAHAHTIFAWEAAGYFDAMRPIVQAFADHNREDLFLDMISVLHMHWASRQSADHQSTDPRGKGYAYQSGLVSYEPLLVEALLDPKYDLGASTWRLMRVIRDLKPTGVQGGALGALVRTVRYLIEPAQSPGLAYRDGRTTAYRSDGVTPVGAPTPFYLMADALAAKRHALANAGEVKEAWDHSTSDLADHFLSVDSGAQPSFHNRRAIALVLHGIDFIKQRLKQHTADRQQWVRETLPGDLEDMLGGPIFAATVDLVNAIESDEQARTAIYLLLAYLIDELKYDEAFQTTVTAGADIMQMLVADADLVPLARLAGRALAPELGIVDTHLSLLHEVRRRDQDLALGQLLRNLHQQTTPGDCPMQAILDAILDVHRLSPGSAAPFSADDYRSAFGKVRDFIEDDRRGLSRFVEVIKNRSVQASE